MGQGRGAPSTRLDVTVDEFGVTSIPFRGENGDLFMIRTDKLMREYGKEGDVWRDFYDLSDLAQLGVIQAVSEPKVVRRVGEFNVIFRSAFHKHVMNLANISGTWVAQDLHGLGGCKVPATHRPSGFHDGTGDLHVVFVGEDGNHYHMSRYHGWKCGKLFDDTIFEPIDVDFVVGSGEVVYGLMISNVGEVWRVEFNTTSVSWTRTRLDLMLEVVDSVSPVYKDLHDDFVFFVKTISGVGYRVEAWGERQIDRVSDLCPGLPKYVKHVPEGLMNPNGKMEHLYFAGTDSFLWWCTGRKDQGGATKWGQGVNTHMTEPCLCGRGIFGQPSGVFDRFGLPQVYFRDVDRHIIQSHNYRAESVQMEGPIAMNDKGDPYWHPLLMWTIDVTTGLDFLVGQHPFLAELDKVEPCHLSRFNASDGCDCGCTFYVNKQLMMDPDCKDELTNGLRCYWGDDGSTMELGPVSDKFECDIAVNLCVPSTRGPSQSCRSLYRYDGENGGDTCGACFPEYQMSANIYNGTGMCKYSYVRGYKVADDEGNPFHDLVQIERGRSSPAMADIDGDGDLDLIVGSRDKYLQFFENVGTREEPKFVAIENTNFTFFPHPLLSQQYFPLDTKPVFVDLNGDGLLDLFVGQYIWFPLYLENVGKKTHPRFIDVPVNETWFPKLAYKRSSVAFHDWDLDGDLDLLIGLDDGTVYGLENVGTATSPRFVLMPGGDRNPFQNMNVRKRAVVKIYDWNNDGLEDVFVQYLDSTGATRVNYWLNVGVAGAPKFATTSTFDNPFTSEALAAIQYDFFMTKDLFSIINQTMIFVGDDFGLIRMLEPAGGRTDAVAQEKQNQLTQVLDHSVADPLNVVQFVSSRPYLAFVDIDDDGDLDLFMAEELGKLSFYENNGFRGAPKYVAVDGPRNPLFSFWRPQDREVSLRFFDIDQDGDYDVFISANWESRRFVVDEPAIRFLRNVGNRTHPRFQEDKEGNPLSMINGTNPFDRLIVEFADMNGDSLVDLIVGGQERGYVDYFENQGVPGSPKFAKMGQDYLVELKDRKYAKVEMIDWDKDGDLDLFVSSTSSRSVEYFENIGNMTFVPRTGKENPFFQVRNVMAMEYYTLVDIDGDSLIDAYVVSSGSNVVLLKNVGLDCHSDCLRRGFCGKIESFNEDVRTSTNLLAISLFRGFDVGDSVGKCWCQNQFAGVACEQCAPDYYGDNCENKCPRFSSTKLKLGEKVYPNGPSEDDCLCDDTFVKVEREGKSSFSCTCGPGFEFSELEEKCIPCGIGSFKESYSLDSCQSCVSILGPRATTKHVGSSSESSCMCLETFVIGGGNRSACVCDKNKFGTSEDPICSACPSNIPFTMSIGAESVDECFPSAGFVKLSNSQVISCQEGDLSEQTLCDQSGVSLENLSLRAGFWRVSTTTLDIRRCPGPTHCNHHHQTKQNNTDIYCSPYHTGILCSECLEGYAYDATGSCRQCSEEMTRRHRGHFAGWVILMVFVVLFPVWRVWRISRAENNKNNNNNNENCCGSFYGRLRMNFKDRVSRVRDATILIRITIGFFQVMLPYATYTGLLRRGPGMEWFYFGLNVDPTSFKMAMPFGCVWIMNHFVRLVIYTLLPIVILLLLCPFLIHPKQQVVEAVVRYVVDILFLVYPGVSSMIFSTFLYDSFPTSLADQDPIRTIRNDPTVNYDSDTGLHARIYAGVMVLVYPIGVAVLFFYILHVHETNNTTSRIKGIRKGYRLYWYEVYELIRKLILASVTLLILQIDTLVGEFLFLILCFLFIWLHRVLNGYEDPVCARFAEITLFMLVTFPILSFAKRVSAAEPQTIYMIVISVSVLHVVALFVAYQVFQKFQHQNQSQHEQKSKSFDINESTSFIVQD